ncbi:GspE/PulE family protein [Nesterenkonia rhizosphaerae]|uniref:Bacterial type II secretion system protein E domain-containing protein n=1 Tax=Nesterenkonia rhizosphaerae TaxID=1348272 RepID=A0ABP9G1A7_9MICC
MSQTAHLPDDYLVTNTDLRFVEYVISRAMEMGASDMLLTTHRRDDEEHLDVEVRVDGRMRPLHRVLGPIVSNIIVHFKNHAGLASSGSFRPEEATYDKVMVDGKPSKARVTSFRTSSGLEAINMRLPGTSAIRPVAEQGVSDENLRRIQQMAARSNKMIMVAGPMGSGKSSLCHGLLSELADGTRAIWTIEDPVERELPGVVQLEVQKEHADFHELLPALVRADYDTLFLGEIRDNETAKAGVRQSKAGRQVLTTIHANDNVTALMRLIELAEDTPLSVLDSVCGVISQRLVGRLNPDWDGVDPLDKYRGRVPINECLLVNDKVVQAIMNGMPLGELRELIFSMNASSRFEDNATELIAAGVTDIDEIHRVLGDGVLSPNPMSTAVSTKNVPELNGHPTEERPPVTVGLPDLEGS